MSEKKDNRALKILVGALALFLIISIVYTFNFYKENQENLENISQEKIKLKSELDTLQKKYEAIVIDNSSLKEELSKEKKRISILLASLDSSKMTNDLLQRYKIEAQLLRMQRQKLLKVVDSFTQENKQLQNVIDSTSTVLQISQKKSDSLVSQNQELANQVQKASVLQLGELKPEGVYLKNNGQAIPTTKANKTKQLRICFKLLENALAKSGERNIFVQVLNPKNNLLGERKLISFGNKNLNYSALSTIDYQNQEIENCILFKVSSEKLTAGRYIVNVFDGENKMATETFTLK